LAAERQIAAAVKQERVAETREAARLKRERAAEARYVARQIAAQLKQERDAEARDLARLKQERAAEATFRVVLPKPHQRWRDLFAVEIVPLRRLPRPVKMWLYDAAHHVVAHYWLGACSTCPTPAGATLTLNIRYHVDHAQPGEVTIFDPASGYRVTVPVILTNLPAPSE
jgi:hypothetical protein